MEYKYGASDSICRWCLPRFIMRATLYISVVYVLVCANKTLAAVLSIDRETQKIRIRRTMEYALCILELALMKVRRRHVQSAFARFGISSS
jgi:hypothetical protein